MVLAFKMLLVIWASIAVRATPPPARRESKSPDLVSPANLPSPASHGGMPSWLGVQGNQGLFGRGEDGASAITSLGASIIHWETRDCLRSCSFSPPVVMGALRMNMGPPRTSLSVGKGRAASAVEVARESPVNNGYADSSLACSNGRCDAPLHGIATYMDRQLPSSHCCMLRKQLVGRGSCLLW
jgi:hypothetical protein